MTATLEQHTLLPPPEGELEDLAAVLRTSAKLVGPDGTEIELRGELYEALREVVAALSQGLAISIVPHSKLLTTQQAADMLGVSRPTLVRLLEDGEIPFDRRGRHRRVRVADVVAYRERARVERRAALAEMTRLAVSDDSYDTVDGFPPTR